LSIDNFVRSPDPEGLNPLDQINEIWLRMFLYRTLSDI